MKSGVFVIATSGSNLTILTKNYSSQSRQGLIWLRQAKGERYYTGMTRSGFPEGSPPTWTNEEMGFLTRAGGFCLYSRDF